MHVALVCPDMHGHLNPMTTLGRELARRGHRVTVAAQPESRTKAERAGLGFVPVGMPEDESGETAADKATLGDLTGFAALRFTGELLTKTAAIGLRDLPGVLREIGADAVVADQVSPAGVSVAEALGLPFVVACNALAMHQEPGVPPGTLAWPYRTGVLARLWNRAGNLVLQFAARPIYKIVNDYRRTHGLDSIDMGTKHGYGLAQVSQQPGFFDFPRTELPPHFHYTGPWHEPERDKSVSFPWSLLDGRPLVYASLGTLQAGLRHVYQAILDGCSTLDAQLVLALGSPTAVWNGAVPANAVVVPFAPQLELLDRAAAVVTHAGLNTALEALARGKPMVCLPVTNDQPGVASRVTWLGAGVMLRPAKATPDRVRAAVTAVLTDAAYRTAAERCAGQMAEVNGLQVAADVIEQALTTGTRVDRGAALAVV